MQEKSNLEQQKKDLQMTLSKLTHEIRNPIALIQSELQMIASAHPEITDFDGWYHVMENLEYIRNLLNELSQYNNAEHLTLIQTDMSAFLNSVTRSFKPALDYLGISLITDIPENLPLLFLDQVKMRQAFLNLLRNAQESIQHSHGIITVSAVSSDNHISIQISDNGCGMTKCQLKIFLPLLQPTNQRVLVWDCLSPDRSYKLIKAVCRFTVFLKKEVPFKSFFEADLQQPPV